MADGEGSATPVQAKETRESVEFLENEASRALGVGRELGKRILP